MAVIARSLGMILLAVFLTVYGVINLGLGIPYAGIILGLLALIAGILLLIGR